MNPGRNQPLNLGTYFLRRILLAGLALLMLSLTGCGMLKISQTPPKAHVSSLLLTNGQTGPVTFPVLQQQVMRFADTYAATVAQACDDVSANNTNPAIRLTMLRWKLGQATSAYTDATGQNPAVNALDLLVLVSMARMVIEGYGVHTYGDAILPLLEAQRNLETNAWTMAGGVLKPSQQQELRDLIKEWRAKNPDQRYIGQVRFREFVAALGRMPSQTATAPTSIFSLLYLDPLAGLDPTAAAIEETRELGERVMYYTQRMPNLLSWQTEVLAYQLAGQPASQQVLHDASQLATSSEIFAQTAQQLPKLINDQRQAAIQQILDGLTDQGNKSRALLTDTRLTLDSAGTAATNINAAKNPLAHSVCPICFPDQRGSGIRRHKQPPVQRSGLRRGGGADRFCRQQPRRTTGFSEPKRAATGKTRAADQNRRRCGRPPRLCLWAGAGFDIAGWLRAGGLELSHSGEQAGNERSQTRRALTGTVQPV